MDYFFLNMNIDGVGWSLHFSRDELASYTPAVYLGRKSRTRRSRPPDMCSEA